METTVSIDFAKQGIFDVNPKDDPSVASIKSKIYEFLTYADSLTVTSIKESKQATDELIISKSLSEALEKRRKEWLKPLQDTVESINSVFKSMSVPLKEADSLIRSKVIAFKKAQEELQQEQERLEQLNRESKQLADNILHKTGEIVDVEDLPPVNIQTVDTKHVYSTLGTSGINKIWKWELVDFSKLPDQYKTPNSTLLNKVVKAGMRDILGIRIYPEDSLKVYSKK